jgi:hypothetical protein
MLLDLEHYVAGSKLIASPIRFGEWLIDRFGDDLIHQRRERERAVQLLEAGAQAEVVAEMGPPPSSARRPPVDPEVTPSSSEVRATPPPPSVPFAHFAEEAERSSSRARKMFLVLTILVLVAVGVFALMAKH